MITYTDEQKKIILNDHGLLIDLVGGTNAVASVAGVKPPSVTSWRKNGIPAYRLAQVAELIEKKLGIAKHETAPDYFPVPKQVAEAATA